MSDQTVAAGTAPTAQPQPQPVPVTDSFAQPDDFGGIQSSAVHTSLSESLSAQFQNAATGGLDLISHGAEYLAAEHGGDAMLAGFASQQPWMHANAPDVPIADAKAQVKNAGLDDFMKLPDQDAVKQPVLDLMLNDARDRAQYAAAVSRGPQGFLPDALGFATQIGAGMIDPVNAAAFSIPVLGEARMGKLMAAAGESILGRAAVRAGVGAAQGAVGGAALTPADWWLHTQDGQDYTMADALKSVVLSAGMGAGFHAVPGVAGDLFNRITGRPLEGAPPIAGTHLPETALAPGGAPADLDEVPGISGGSANIDQPINAPRHPADVLADLPQRAQEDVVHAAIARIITGEPVNAGELLQEASKADPRIAESVNGPRETAAAASAAGPGKAKPPQSLLQFLVARGGLKSDDPLASDLLQSFGGKNPTVGNRGKLLREDGMPLDQAREAAVEAGYIHDAAEEGGGVTQSSINDLLDAVDREANGEKQYPRGQEGFVDKARQQAAEDEESAQQEKHSADVDAELEQGMTDHGVAEPLRRFVKRRALDLMNEHGSDPETALERAIPFFEDERATSLDHDELLDPLIREVRRLGSPIEIARQWAADPEATWEKISDLIPRLKAAEKEVARRHGVKLADIEDAPLSAKEDHFMFRDARTGVDYWRDLRSQLQPVETLDEAAQEIAHELKRLPEDTAKLSDADELVLARLQALFSEVDRLKGHIPDVLRIAAGKYGARFSDPNDAADMVASAAERLQSLFEGRTRAAAKERLSLPGRGEAARGVPDWARLTQRAIDDEAPATNSDQPPSPAEAPERRLSRAQAAAAEADKLIDSILPQLSDEERKTFQDALANLENDKDAREQIVRDGAACLAEASVGVAA